MPTILRWKGHRFFFYSNEGREPPHVHVNAGDREAKIWLHDLSVAANIGYPTHELNALVKEVERRREDFLKAWHDHFGA